jgi:hypothetical protein
VSAGYLRHFADGNFVRLWNKESNSWTGPVGVRDCFVEKGLNSLISSDPESQEHLEREWEKVEDSALPAIAAARGGDLSENVVGSIKSLTAMHFVRSYTLRDFSMVAIEQQRGTASSYEALPKVMDAFKSEHRRDPLPGEIEQRVLAQLDAIKESNLYFVESSVRMYAEVIGILDPLKLSLVVPANKGVGFLTGDMPVVIASDIRVGIREGVRIGKAELIYFPLGRHLGAIYGDLPPIGPLLAPQQVQALNHLLWRSCSERLAAHPAENIPRALAKAAPFGWPPEDQTPGWVRSGHKSGTSST